MSTSSPVWPTAFEHQQTDRHTANGEQAQGGRFRNRYRGTNVECLKGARVRQRKHVVVGTQEVLLRVRAVAEQERPGQTAARIGG